MGSVLVYCKDGVPRWPFAGSVANSGAEFVESRSETRFWQHQIHSKYFAGCIILYNVVLISQSEWNTKLKISKWEQKKIALYLSVNVFSTVVLTGDRHFTWSSQPREGLAICRAKVVLSFVSHFKTLRVGPVQGIEPATSRSAVKRSTDWANPAAAIEQCFPLDLSQIMFMSSRTLNYAATRVKH